MREGQRYVVDTHTLLWFIGKDRHLGRHARAAIEAVNDVLLPTIVLAEALTVIEKRRVGVPLSELLEAVQGDAFIVVPFGVRAFREMAGLPPSLELHDRMIAATARLFDATVLTRDRAFAGVVETLW